MVGQRKTGALLHRMKLTDRIAIRRNFPRDKFAKKVGRGRRRLGSKHGLHVANKDSPAAAHRMSRGAHRKRLSERFSLPPSGREQAMLVDLIKERELIAPRTGGAAVGVHVDLDAVIARSLRDNAKVNRHRSIGLECKGSV